jgi:tetratricopeptide (TPR) repeat protein
VIEPLLQAERLLLHGMVEQAEQIYRRVAEQDPLNSIAVVGLARVALERGDDEGALQHARAALAIDPQNDAAVRLEARLSEVLAERGKSPAQAPPTASPGWSSSEPAGPVPAPDARPSEQAIFTRNPSMADHQRMQTERPQEPEAQAEPAPPTPNEGLLQRLRRRLGGG